MTRTPVFHEYSYGTATWEKVLPGDCVICPGTLAYFHSDFSERTDDTRVLRLAHRPIIVLGICAYVPSKDDDLKTTNDLEYATYVVLSRHGILCVPLKRKTPNG